MINLQTTIFRSNQFGVTEDNLFHFFTYIDYCASLELYDIQINPSGFGHYSIKVIFDCKDFENNNHRIEVKTKTNNMQLVDAWKSGMNGMYEDGEDGFENWNDVVESMLCAIDAENEIIEQINC